MPENVSSVADDSYSPVYITARVIVSLGSVVGNSLVIYLFLAIPRLQTTSNWFIFSLAFADFFVGLFLTPIDIFLAYSPDIAWYTVTVLDVIYDYIIDVAVLAVCALIFDRYLAITKPLRYQSFMTKRRAILMIVLSWSIPAVLGLPYIALVLQEDELFDEELAYRTALLFLFQLLPSIAMLLFCLHIFFIIRGHSRRTAVQMDQLSYNQHAVAEPAIPNQPRLVLRFIIAKLVAILSALFVLCHAVAVYKTIVYAFDLLEVPLVVDRVSLFMIHFNSFANFGVYALLNKDIRYELNRLFGTRASN